MGDFETRDGGDAGTGDFAQELGSHELFSTQSLLNPDFIETQLTTLASLHAFINQIAEPKLYQKETVENHEAQRVLFCMGEAIYCLRFHERFGTYQIVPLLMLRQSAEEGQEAEIDQLSLHGLHVIRQRFPSTVLSPSVEDFLESHPDPGNHGWNTALKAIERADNRDYRARMIHALRLTQQQKAAPPPPQLLDGDTKMDLETGDGDTKS